MYEFDYGSTDYVNASLKKSCLWSVMEAKGKVEKEGINPVRIEILNNDVQSVLQYETVQSETLITPVAGIGPEVHYVIGNTFVAQNESTTSGEEYAFSQDNREFQLIDLNEDNSEIEIVTVDGANILRDFQISSESFQIIDGNLNIQLPITSSSDGFPKPQQLVSIPGLSTSLSVSRSRNQKNAPALLRNSRRVEETMKLPSSGILNSNFLNILCTFYIYHTLHLYS